LYAKAYYGHDIESLKTLIRNGRQPVPRADAKRPQPGLYMPAWKDRISENDLEALVAYLFSLAERLPGAQMAEAPASPPDPAVSAAPEPSPEPASPDAPPPDPAPAVN
jgi:mono/diheme cytochrome c family protein